MARQGMTEFYAALDGHDDPCIWARDQIVLDPFRSGDVCVLRRSDLDPGSRRFWDDIVQRMTVTVLPHPEDLWG